MSLKKGSVFNMKTLVFSAAMLTSMETVSGMPVSGETKETTSQGQRVPFCVSFHRQPRQNIFQLALPYSNQLPLTRCWLPFPNRVTAFIKQRRKNAFSKTKT
jgi:hypothetical protein